MKNPCSRPEAVNAYDLGLLGGRPSDDLANSDQTSETDVVGPAAFRRYFEDLADQLDSQSRDVQFRTMLASGMASAVGIGYLAWTIRGGYFLASLLASTPAWAKLEPLPVLQFVQARESDRRRGSERLGGRGIMGELTRESAFAAKPI